MQAANIMDMRSTGFSRRKLLQLTGATTLGALAGCAGQLPGTDDDGGREVTPAARQSSVSGSQATK